MWGKSLSCGVPGSGFPETLPLHLAPFASSSYRRSYFVFRSLLSRAYLRAVGNVPFVLDGRCRMLRYYATLGSRRSLEHLMRTICHVRSRTPPRYRSIRISPKMNPENPQNGVARTGIDCISPTSPSSRHQMCQSPISYREFGRAIMGDPYVSASPRVRGRSHARRKP